MKKALIIIAVLFMSASFINAQEAQKGAIQEPAKAEEVKKAEPAKEAVKQEVKKEAQAATVKEEKKTDSQGKEKYISDLSSKDENKILAATEWLAEKEEKSAVPQLVDLLKNDKRIKVRAFASVALGVIADESCIPALNDALINDSSADVRYAVLLAIHRINPGKSLDALKKAKETESDPYIKDYIDKMEAKWREKK